MKLPWDKNYLKISFHVIFTLFIIYCLGLMVTYLSSVVLSVKEMMASAFKLLSPLIIGIIIAYLLDPLVEWYEKQLGKITFPPSKIKIIRSRPKKKRLARSRKLATFLTFLTVIVALSIFVTTLLYTISNQVVFGDFDETINQMTKYIESLNSVLKDIESNLARYNISSEEIQQQITSYSEALLSWVQNFGLGLIDYLKNLTGHVTNLFFALIVAIYLLTDKHGFLHSWNLFLKALLPETVNKKLHLYWQDLDHILSGYIRGQMLDALIMCFLLSITLSLVGIPFAVLIGITAGVANLVPYFGPLVANVLAIGMALITGNPMKAIYAFIGLTIVQQIDGNIIGPKLLGSSVDLHPVFVLLSIVIGGSLYGLFGMLLAVPVAAVIRLALKRFIAYRLDK